MAYQSLLYGGLGDLEANLSYGCNTDVNLKCSSPCGTQQNGIVIIPYRWISFAYMNRYIIYMGICVGESDFEPCEAKNMFY